MRHDGAIDAFQSHSGYLSSQDIAVAVVTKTFPDPPAGNPNVIAVVVAESCASCGVERHLDQIR